MIYCDTEYNNDQVILWCSQKDDNPEKDIFDLRTPEGVDLLRKYINDNSKQVFIAYAASAEVTSLLRLGVDVRQLLWIDLLVECRVITQSHPKYTTFQQSTMLSQVKALLDLDVDESHKERMVNLILDNTSWDDAQWAEIVKYCIQDVEYLPLLFNKVLDIYKENKDSALGPVMLDRGYQVRICAEMDYASEGFPVYGENIFTIFNNKAALKSKIIETLPMEFLACYQGKVLKRNRLLTLINQAGWKWELTNNGLPTLKAEYLKELKNSLPVVEPLYQVIKTTATLNSRADILDKVKDGYIKNKTFCYTAVTGRNGLRQTSGYLLNFPKWIRRVIQPHPGMAFIGFDYSQQEIAIGAALSNDVNLLSAYNTGDLYLELGKMSQLIPADGTKQTHSVERQMMKALQLGLSYGKGLPGLTMSIGAILQDRLDAQSIINLSEKIFNWHKKTFYKYWSWTDLFVNTAYNRGFCESKDRFRKWVNRKTPKTQLQNFPCQSNGAYMLREVVKLVYKDWQDGVLPPLLCSQHDAIYFNAKEEDADKVVKRVRELMEKASIDTIGVPVKVDSHVYTQSNPYEPDGYTKAHEDLWNMATDKNTYLT